MVIRLKSVNFLIILPINLGLMLYSLGCAHLSPVKKVLYPNGLDPDCGPVSIIKPLETGPSLVCMSLDDWSRVRRVTARYCSK